MAKKTITSRQKQAMQTKEKVFKAAVSLMQKHGFEETTIEQICDKAKVSVGSFYNYFKSKYDVLFVVYESADIYYRDVVAPEIEALDIEEKILHFFAHYARYNKSHRLDFVKKLYGNSENKLFIKQDRFMHKLLHNILIEAQEQGKLSSAMTLDDAEQFLFIVARGIVNDWCLFDGFYDLEYKMNQYYKSILPLFILPK